MLNVAINGFGRICRNTLRNLLLRKPNEINVVAINDLTDAQTLAHLFKYDSVHGPYPGMVAVDADRLIIDAHPPIQIVSEGSPEQLPWASLDVDVIVESTGKFTTMEHAMTHVAAGAKPVVISNRKRRGGKEWVSTCRSRWSPCD